MTQQQSKLTPAQAIKAVGVSRAAFYRKAKELSKITEGKKTYFDASELIRVFGSIQNIDEREPVAIQTELEQRLLEKSHEIEILRIKLDAAETHIKTQAEHIETLKALTYTATEKTVEKSTKAPWYKFFQK